MKNQTGQNEAPKDEWARPGGHSLPEVVGTDRGGGHSSAQRTLQAARTLMELFLWKLESKKSKAVQQEWKP